MRKYLFALIVIFIISCSINKTPKGILTGKEMIPVLVDIHLAEGINSQRYALDATRKNYPEDLYLSILKKHKLDQKVFEESILYYGKHPDKYKPIYDEVVDRLNEMNVKSRAKDSLQIKK
jgi:hypothetical protein